MPARPRSPACAPTAARTPTGPSNASTVASTSKISFHAQAASNSNARSDSAAAAVTITLSSKIAQPRHCSTFSPVAR